MPTDGHLPPAAYTIRAYRAAQFAVSSVRPAGTFANSVAGSAGGPITLTLAVGVAVTRTGTYEVEALLAEVLSIAMQGWLVRF